MKIRFLGTGAADWPAKKPADAAEFRRLSSALIDGVLLIDPGPDVPDALARFGKDPTAIRTVLFTHRHGDHFCAATVEWLSGAALVPLQPGEERELDGFCVRALAANHPTAKSPVHFLIDDGERRLFYGLDGAWLLMDEVKAIQSRGVDLAVLDATVGDVPGDYRIFEHNNLNMVLEMQKTLSPFVKTFCISHMARTLHTDHNTLSEKMKKYDVITAYDGLSIEI
jgi:adenosylcobinamide kinase/adenosylcobinamide-phosphate guanylyltransferase